MTAPKRLSTDGGASLGQNPFQALDGLALPAASPPIKKDRPLPLPQSTTGRGKLPKNRGRVDIVREIAGRGGKTVTVVSGFVGIGLPEKESLTKTMRRACGVGGTVKEGRIEIQGDKRDEIMRILLEAGFQPVFAGG